MFKLGLSHPSEHKFKNSFQDTLNPLRDRGSETKATTLFSLPTWETLLLSKTRTKKNRRFITNDCTNIFIITIAIEYILATKLFDVPLSIM